MTITWSSLRRNGSRLAQEKALNELYELLESGKQMCPAQPFCTDLHPVAPVFKCVVAKFGSEWPRHDEDMGSQSQGAQSCNVKGCTGCHLPLSARWGGTWSAANMCGGCCAPAQHAAPHDPACSCRRKSGQMGQDPTSSTYNIALPYDKVGYQSVERRCMPCTDRLRFDIPLYRMATCPAI